MAALTGAKSNNELDAFRSRIITHICGFMLIDLLIAIVVLAILASIAYPTYAEHLRKTHRAEAKVILMESVQYMERYYAIHNTYVGARVDAISSVSPKGAHASHAKYQISFMEKPTLTTYTLQAIPLNGQQKDSCGALTVNQLGTQTSSTSFCW